MSSARRKGTVLLRPCVNRLFETNTRIYLDGKGLSEVSEGRGCIFFLSRWKHALTRLTHAQEESVGSGDSLSYRSPVKARDERLSVWREQLPSKEETQRSLKAGGRTRQEVPGGAAPVTEDGLGWRECVDVSRSLYEEELKRMGSVTFREYLVNRSLVDTYGRRHTYLRVSLTEKCNLRCLYCMPEEGVDLTAREKLLTVDEIERLVGLFALAGVRKVRLTGGEPTIRRDIQDVVGRIARIKGIDDVGITSNGLTLNRSLRELKDLGLSLINVSLDTLQPERFERMTRRKGHDRVLKTIDHALDLGFDPVKVNVVVMKGVNDDELMDFVELTRDKNINVRFIEYMPFDGNVWSNKKLVSFDDMKRIVADSVVLERCADGYGEVAKNYRVPGYHGTVSFITSMTKAFCSECTRLRLMADGNVKVCLFGANEVSLRDAIRQGATDDELLAVISAAVDRKKPAHAGMDVLYTLKNRPMVKIGG